MQLTDPSRVWMTLLVGLAGVLIVSYIWARSLAKNLTIVREIRYGWVQVGDVLEERFTLKNHGWFPATWAEVQDHSSLPGYDATLATGVDGNSVNQWQKKGTCDQRGLFQVGDTGIQTGDPFGIFSVTITNPEKISVLVMPPVIPLPQLEIAPGGYSGEGRPMPHSLEHTLDSSSVREYAPGDSLRLVHWKTTAHQGKPFVRLFDGAPASNWWILLDLQNEAQVGAGKDSTEEYGIILAASLAERGLRLRHGVGLIVNGKKLGWQPPRTGEVQRWEILRTLALASRGEMPISEILEHIRPNLGNNTSLIVITPTSKLDWLQALPHLAQRAISPTILLFDRHTFDPLQENSRVVEELKRINVACHTIPRDMLDRPEAHPGMAGHWEWKFSPSGRAIPVRAPKDHEWRRLAK